MCEKTLQSFFTWSQLDMVILIQNFENIFYANNFLAKNYNCYLRQCCVSVFLTVSVIIWTQNNCEGSECFLCTEFFPGIGSIPNRLFGHWFVWRNWRFRSTKLRLDNRRIVGDHARVQIARIQAKLLRVSKFKPNFERLISGLARSPGTSASS